MADDFFAMRSESPLHSTNTQTHEVARTFARSSKNICRVRVLAWGFSARNGATRSQGQLVLVGVARPAE